MIVVAIIGILASIAIPQFSKFQARARQAEAKMNLKAIFEVTKANWADQGTYRCGLCGWEPTKNYTYNYFTDAGTGLTNGKKGCAASTVGVTAAQTDGTGSAAAAFTAIAAGDIDADTFCDGWVINDGSDLQNVKDDVNN